MPNAEAVRPKLSIDQQPSYMSRAGMSPFQGTSERENQIGRYITAPMVKPRENEKIETEAKKEANQGNRKTTNQKEWPTGSK